MGQGSILIKYALPWSAEPIPVRIDMYDLRGRLVSTLVNESKPCGYYSAVFDSRTSNGATGLYLLRLKAGKQQKVLKSHLMK
jgi:hypothetical protein